MTADDRVDAVLADLRSRGVRYCIGAYVDIHGAQKAKVVPIGHLGHMAAGSERYTGYALDGLGQAPNDDEFASVPDLSHIIQLPWEPKLAWMPANLTFQGKPYPLSTRVVLERVLGEAAALGFTFNLGIECEIFLLRKAADGSLEVPHPTDDLDKPCYDVRGFVSNFAWLDRMASTIDALGWDLYSFDHEDANGQFEFDFAYADALTTCDRLTFFRFMAKHYAEQDGLVATMMPKPFADKTGNGAHFNMSLADRKTGRNLFACAPEADPRGLGLTDIGYHFIGGILKHGRALCAVLAPTVNSYKRLVRQGAMAGFSWAPVFNSFGSNNRTNSVRVPAGGGRCESRNADGSVNPYLAAALVLAAGLEGVRERIDPGQPNDDNLYAIADDERRRRGIEFLPQTLQEAIQAFADDPFIEATLGRPLRDEFIRTKSEEWRDYHLTISAWETARYSTMFLRAAAPMASNSFTSSRTADPYGAQAHARAMAGMRAEAMPVVPASAAVGLPPDVTPDRAVWEETIAGGGYAARQIARGTRLRLVDLAGDGCISLLVFNAERTVERLNVADTVKVQWNAYLGAGSLLLSDMGRVLMSLVEDDAGTHDAFCGASNAASNERRYGDGHNYGAHPNARDRFMIALAKVGLGRRDIHPCMNFFKGIRIEADGATRFEGGPFAPGRAVTLRAEMDVQLVLANCPHVLDPRPAYTVTPVRATAWRAPTAAEDDPIRTATPEGLRAFLNTEDYYRR